MRWEKARRTRVHSPGGAHGPGQCLWWDSDQWKGWGLWVLRVVGPVQLLRKASLGWPGSIAKRRAPSGAELVPLSFRVKDPKIIMVMMQLGAQEMSCSVTGE